MIKKKLWIIVTGFIFLALLSCSGHKFSRLMSWEEYIRQPRKNPYVLELESKKGNLLYYGAFHSVDLEHPQFTTIERRWTAFRPTLALSEGNIWPLESTRDEAIRKHGEQGLLRFLAARDSVPIICIDPPRLLQAKYLRNYFSAEQVKVYIILRQAKINQMLERDPNDLSDTRRFLVIMEEFKSFRFPPHRLIDFEEIVENLFPNLKDWQKISEDYFYNVEKGKFLPQVHRKLMDYRDQHMLRKLFKELRNGHRIFAIVGRSHVVMQEPVLRAKLGSPRTLVEDNFPE